MMDHQAITMADFQAEIGFPEELLRAAEEVEPPGVGAVAEILMRRGVLVGVAGLETQGAMMMIG